MVLMFNDVRFIYYFIVYFRDQYSDTLTRQWVGVFNDIFAEDNYTPIYIEDEAEYISVITQFPFQDEELTQVYLLSCCIFNSQ